MGLALVATGLTGVLLLSFQGGLLGWTNRLTQYLGSAYLFVAAFMAARETGSWAFSLAPAEERSRVNSVVAGFRQQTLLGWALRYGLAVVAVTAAMGARQAAAAWVGPGLPAYITFYPVVMIVALLGGIGPGLLATVLAGLSAGYWILPPAGQFAIAAPVDRLGLVIFISSGLFLSAVAELYRRHRHKAAAYDRQAAVRESQARLAAFAEATFEGIGESEAGRIVDCNEQLARMLGYSVAELMGAEIASLIAPEDRERVMANIRQGQESSSEHAMLRKDGTRIFVEAHGRPVSPGSAKRLTAIRDITQRKRAESALQTTLQRFYDVLSSMSSGVLLVTEEGRVEFANQAICDQFGLTDAPAGLVGLEAWDMIEKIKNGYLHPDEAVARIRGIVGQGQVVKGEEIAMKGGRACLRDFVPLVVKGKSCGRLWLHFDITERKRTEETLRQGDERFRALADAMSQLAWIAHPDGFIHWYNRRWYEFTGTTPEQMEGWGWQSVHDPQALPQVLEQWKASIASGKPFDMVFPLRGADGQFRRFLTRGQPLKDPQGRVVQWFGTNTDVDELKRAEEAAQVSEERLRFALETSHNGAWDLDLVDHTAFRSLEHDRIFGYAEPLPQWTYEMFLEHVLPEDRPVVDAKFRQATTMRSDWSFECRIRRADGQVRWIWAAGQHRTEATGGMRRMAGIIRDITERKQAGQEIERRAEELRATNAELTRFNQAMVGRELRMIELKKEVNGLCRKLGQPLRYPSGFHEEPPPASQSP